MKNSILHQIYARYEKNVKEENRSFKKDLQVIYRVFLHKSNIFSFVD